MAYHPSASTNGADVPTVPGTRVGPRTRISPIPEMRISTPSSGGPTVPGLRRTSAGGAVATCDVISVIP